MTEPKLANFPEVDAYVIISCPYSTFFDFKDFYKILINPFELELVLSGKDWSSYILSDVQNILHEKFNLGPDYQNEPTNINMSEDSERKKEEIKEDITGNFLAQR